MNQTQETFPEIVEKKWEEYFSIYDGNSNAFLHIAIPNQKINHQLKRPLEFFLPISSGVESIIAHISDKAHPNRFEEFVKLENNGLLIPKNLADNYNLQIDNTYQVPKEVRIYFP